MLPRTTYPVLALFILVSFGGCTSPYRRALAPDASGQLGNVSGVVALRQQEIDTSINPSNLTAAAGGGLIFAIIDAAANSHSAKKNENFAGPLRQALLEYRFEESVLPSLTAQFGGEGKLQLTTIVVAADTTLDDLGRLVNEAQGDAVAAVFPHYLLAPDFKRLVLTADVLLCARKENLYPFAKDQAIAKQQVHLLYRNAFQSSWPLPRDLWPEDTVRENMVVAWSADDGRPVRNALDSACAEIVAMLDWDLSVPAAEKYLESGKPRVGTLSYLTPAPIAVVGQSIQNRENRRWIRIVNGQLFAEPDSTAAIR